ncbi:MAG: 1,4-dihydroxy-2-naphthoate polyprenyltransferase [Planctomycetota bacterium]|nr:1,4-dihydroxy-2-naphthoate polyprenyltransferase [Planctomycetota bacterium]
MHAEPPPTRLAVWCRAARPQTLPAALTPVAMGVVIAWRAGQFDLLPALGALVGGLLIQIGTNFANDYFDFAKGTDTAARLGPARMVQQGHITPATMRRAFVATFALALLVGAALVWHAGWPIAVIGLLSIGFGVLYTGGPRPLGYLGLGDVLVLAFFGPIATAGTHYVQALAWSPAAIVAGLAPGLLGVALLTVNNLRDMEGDRSAGKRTLAVRFGARFAKAEFALCLLGAAAVPFVLWYALGAPVGVLAASAACGLGVRPLLEVAGWQSGRRLSDALAGSGRLLVGYGIAFCLGWAL